MKRLVDSSTSDLSKSLLRAGIEHQAPAQGRMKLLVALGVGGGLTLATSKALAWLATSSGKLTVLATGIAMTSTAVYLSTDVAPVVSSTGVVSTPQRQEESAIVVAPKWVVSESPVAASGRAPKTPTKALLDPKPPSLPVSPRSAGRRDEVRTNEQAQRRTVGKVGTLRHVTSDPVGRPSQVPELGHSGQPTLEQEIEWVDRIRLAVDRGDGTHFRLATRYYRLYPNGQLKGEVERLCR